MSLAQFLKGKRKKKKRSIYFADSVKGRERMWQGERRTSKCDMKKKKKKKFVEVAKILN